MKPLLFWIGLVFTISVSAWMVKAKETLLANGRVVLLQLRPLDPRSIMQGDYMVLRYALADDVKLDDAPRRGRLVLLLDENKVGKIVQIHDGRELATNEVLLEYRDAGGLAIGAETYLFQEGDASVFNAARYAELRVGAGGECLLTGLRDEAFKLLESASARE